MLHAGLDVAVVPADVDVPGSIDVEDCRGRQARGEADHVVVQSVVGTFNHSVQAVSCRSTPDGLEDEARGSSARYNGRGGDDVSCGHGGSYIDRCRGKARLSSQDGLLRCGGHCDCGTGRGYCDRGCFHSDTRTSAGVSNGAGAWRSISWDVRGRYSHLSRCKRDAGVPHVDMIALS